nr:xylulose kinase-1 [Tanacetum cinerariifolium]
MEHYLEHTDYLIWEFIQKGNGYVQVLIDTNRQIRVLPPKTAEEILARERERKARTILLMAIPEDHLEKFHKVTDANEMWEAIKSRFGRNDESEKMQKYLLKKQFESFSVSNLEGLHKGYDSGPQLDHEDLEQVNEFDPEEMDLKWQVAMISTRLKKFYKKTGRKRRDAENSGYKARDNGNRPAKQDEHKAMVIIEGEGVDWTGHAEDDTKVYALMAFNSSNSGSDTEVTSCSKVCKESYAKLKKLYDEQREQLGDATIEIQAYTLALKKVEAQLICHQKNQLAYEEKIRFMKIDLDDKTNVLICHKKLLTEAKREKEELKAKLENFQSSSKGLSKLLNSQMSAKDKSRLGYESQIHKGSLGYQNEVFESVFEIRSSDVEDSPVNDRFAKVEEIHAVPPPMTGNYMPPKFDFGIDYSSKETLETVPQPVESKPKVVNEPKVWSNALIIEEYKSDSDDEYVSKASVA